MREGKIQVHSENMMPIIKKWLYSDKDIFLRELISNGCDAIKKLEKLILMGEAEIADYKPRINVRVDKEARTLSFEDNGLGMTEEEVEKYITQVAFSGAQEFVERYKDKGEGSDGIIGHFGLGFYSAFMVAENIEIDTLSYIKDAKPVHWVSNGESTYEIGEGTRTERGTLITLHISENEAEFLEESRIRELLRKYCAFMPYEVYLDPKTPEELKKDADGGAPADGKEPDGDAPAEEKPVNSTTPLWLKAPKDCTDEEYKKFYSELFLDFNPPLFWIHLNVDYPFNLKGILYFPKQSNKLEVMPGEIKLYSNQVYIADNIKEVVPEFLMLLKGVIDCPDLPLNVSRSFLQNDGDVQKISKHISKKVSDKLHSIFADERESYDNYWDDISPFIKYGCIRDEGFYDRVKDILLLKDIDGKYIPLGEFPKDKDGKIYYVSDENLQAQYVRLFKEQGVQAAVLTHIIDSHFISFIEYKEQGTHFTRIDSEIGSSMKDEENKTDDADKKKIVESFSKSLDIEGLKVEAERLKNDTVPAVMLLSEYARRMQDMSKLYGGEMFGATEKPETTLMLNLGNTVVKALPALSEEKQKLVSRQIYDLAMLSHKPLDAEEMNEFIGRSVEILGMVAEKTENKES